MMQKINKFLIRHAQLRDVYFIKEIEESCFSEPWSEKSIIDSLNNDKTYFILAEKNQEVIGYAGMYYIDNEGYMYNIAVKTKYRNIGVGKSLIQELFTFCINKKIDFLTLEVRKSNVKAINLYKSLKFNIVGYRKNFYSHPQEDATIMTRFFYSYNIF